MNINAEIKIGLPECDSKHLVLFASRVLYLPSRIGLALSVGDKLLFESGDYEVTELHRVYDCSTCSYDNPPEIQLELIVIPTYRPKSPAAVRNILEKEGWIIIDKRER